MFATHTPAFDGQRTPHFFAVFSKTPFKRCATVFPHRLILLSIFLPKSIFSIADSRYRYFYTKIFYNAVAFFWRYFLACVIYLWYNFVNYCLIKFYQISIRQRTEISVKTQTGVNAMSLRDDLVNQQKEQSQKNREKAKEEKALSFSFLHSGSGCRMHFRHRSPSFPQDIHHKNPYNKIQKLPTNLL